MQGRWMTDVFVSYARQNETQATRIAEELRQSGYTVWRDDELPAHRPYADVIEERLKSAKAVVVLWSAESAKSHWVRAEADTACETGTLVQALLDRTLPPMPFNQIQCANLKGWEGDTSSSAWRKLEASVAALVKGTSEAAGSELKSSSVTAIRASVCVLPFSNMSGDPEQEYFSDGISEDITTDLSKISALEVVARNTAFGFKGQSPDVKDVAKQLNVSHVLEGSVRKAGNRIRINAQLIDGATGKHLWADRFDRDLTDIFDIQDEISKAIVDALQLKLLPQEKDAIEDRGTSNVDAYSLYLMARERWISGGFSYPDRHRMIVRLCREATTLDPEYAQAWALMALAQALLRFWHGTEEDALPAAERALALNPALPEAHCVKARYLDDEGRPEESERQIQTALKLAPQSWEANREMAAFFYRHARIDEAIPFFDKAASAMESDTSSAAMLMSCYQAVGDSGKLRGAAELCISRAERAIAQDPSHANELAWGASALSTLGKSDRARDWARRAILIDPDNQSMRYNLACAFSISLGDRESAIETLGPYFERLDSRMQLRHLESDPDFAPISDDPRFKAMLEEARSRLGTR
ncbi:MAG: TIR domain-containing protein [Sphingomicrobium sp.]